MRPHRRSSPSGHHQFRGITGLRRTIAESGVSMVSSDVFDTVLLRDSSSETERLAEASELAAARLGIDPALLTKLRWNVQQSGYGAVSVERPKGEATLSGMVATIGRSLDLDEAEVEILRTAELETDARHLRPNLPLLRYYASLRSAGVRVVALSDIYYSTSDVLWLLSRVVGTIPFDTVYVSADLGCAKHVGQAFAEVARREGIDRTDIVHIGDSVTSDVVMARRAGWRAVHLPRGAYHRALTKAGALAALPLWVRRIN